MNILITGCNGQLGNEMRLQAPLHPDHRFFYTDIIAPADSPVPVEVLDITDREAVHQYVQTHAIELIVNCAAYTNVDKAEEDEPTATRINADAVENLGSAGCRVIHVSTDYVFSGDEHLPCREDDPVAPRTAYGRTKLQGEQRLLAVCPDAIILRTAWLYSAFGNNFVKTMIRLGLERDELGVVFDQIGTPTYAADLAAAIGMIIETEDWFPGIYHFTDEGVCSWYDFTVQIHKLYNSQQLLLAYRQGKPAEQMPLITCAVRPIRSEEYQYRTPRPHYSVLDKQKIRRVYNVPVPYWTDALARCMQQLYND
ncbi:MAG: dTDP-4-dehydrorhamnose reductase [Paludibacteraceae bacterium]|nr:dTDP-4-dehydrorhamnose reductase [Paludibacteraceae bacterium]